MRLSVARHEGLDEGIVADIDDGWRDSAVLGDRQKSALAFADAFLANEPDSVSLLRGDAGFDDAQRAELALGLGLFLGMSKVLITMGLEPAPGTMATTEVATPDTSRPYGHLSEGMDALGAALDAALAPHADTVAVARARVGQLVRCEPSTAGGSAAPAAVLDVTELFVIDAHAITDEQVAALRAAMGISSAAFLVALAHADASARLVRSGATPSDTAS